jgi:hypothetical protein
MQRIGRTRSRGARWGATLWIVGMIAMGWAARPAHAQDAAGTPPPPPLETSWRPRPVRSGTVSLGGGPVYGTLLGAGLGKEFTNGLGLGFSLRYRSSFDQGYGLSFEAHNFAIGTKSDSAAGRNKLQYIETTFDYYAYGSTRTRMPRYLVLGAGLVQTRITDNDGEKEYPGDGGVFKVGAGLEYWQSRSMTIDFSVRYHGVFLHQKLDHDLEAALALNFYTSP